MSKELNKDLEAVDSLNIDGDLNKLCSDLDINTKAGIEFVRIALANARLMDRKQRDYGPRNIAGFGTFGTLVRMNDKFERLKTLFGKGKRKRAINESMHDTFRDISNYAIISLMLDLDRWPND